MVPGYSGLFDFLVDRHLAKDRVVFLQLDPVGCVLAVFRRHVTGRAGHARSPCARCTRG